MSRIMRLDQAILVTRAHRYQFNLRANCTVLDGPVGTGKSSLLELIKFAFGGSAVLTPVIRQEVLEVRLLVRLGNATVWLRRPLGRRGNIVDVRRAGHDELSLPVRSSVGDLTIGEYLLDLLGIPKVRIPRSRANAGAATVPLTFGDLFSYLYVAQQEIDRSVVGHTEVFREPKRRAMFELLFGLTDARQLELETRVGELRDEMRRAEGKVVSIRAFLDAAKIDDETTLEERLATLRDRESVANADLTRLRDEVGARTKVHQDLIGEVRKSEARLTAAIARHRDAEELVHGREELLAQMHLDYDRGVKAAAASLQLAPLDFVSCPRCLQDLPEDRGDVSHCRLCLQETVPLDLGLTNPGDVDDARVDELHSLLRDARAQLELADAEVQRWSYAHERSRAELDRVTADAVTPRFSDIEVLSSQRARAGAEAESVASLLGFWGELRRLESAVLVLSAERASSELELSDLRARLAERREILSELSEVFDATVRFLEVPWAESASIDERTYLPVVNGERFESLAVAGGTKTVVTVAYHLALLNVALSRSDVLLPGLLILDTPRKNLGFNDLDSELGARIYRRIRTLVDAYEDAVQFVVADNDVPRDPSWITVRHLDYDRPLIEHVAHPGEEAVTSGALPTVGTLVER
jgi:hypothetical protein